MDSQVAGNPWQDLNRCFPQQGIADKVDRGFQVADDLLVDRDLVENLWFVQLPVVDRPGQGKLTVLEKLEEVVEIEGKG